MNKFVLCFCVVSKTGIKEKSRHFHEVNDDERDEAKMLIGETVKHCYRSS